MSNVNRVELLGNLGCDVSTRYLSSGVCTSSFRLATNERWTDKNGDKQQRTEWHRIVVWGRLAEACAEYLSKGRRVRVEGSLRTRSWTDREGVKRYVTEIHARRVDFIDRRREEKEESNSGFESDIVTENLTAVQSTPRCHNDCSSSVGSLRSSRPEVASVNEESIAKAIEEGLF